MPKSPKQQARLELWKERLARCQVAYESENERIEEREVQYLGDKRIRPLLDKCISRKTVTTHIRNISSELIESQVDSNIPAPKVTARRQQDEAKAKLIEDMLRGELDRLPIEQINDMMERTVPIQGGAAYLVEWDNSAVTHYTTGELAITALHPKMIVPQDGVYDSIESMDYIILKFPQTKEYIYRRYGVDVYDEGESEPDVKGGSESTAEDLVTQYSAYYRSENGGIGLFSWVADTILEDFDDYQSRRLRRCTSCGAPQPPEGETEPGGRQTLLGELPGEGEAYKAPRGRCPYCGGKYADGDEKYEEIYIPIVRSDGSVIPGEDYFGNPTRIPYYKPDIYPIILQKNVSVYGRFLGESDLDKIASQQNTTNRIELKIIEKLLSSGSYITLPDAASIRTDESDGKAIRIGNAADKQLIGVYDLEGDIEQDMAYLAQVYEEARQVIGITDSFQGRRDPTATSGKAKEFSAAQSAGRMESKRIMKHTAYAALFEAMFKFKLAYADEPRPVISHDDHGNPIYQQFSRYDFLEQDAAGEWIWNDQFLFSCDTAAPLASNREAMWQETRMNLQTGAFGDPAQLGTLILFWSKMDELHYPGAKQTKAYLEEELKRQQQAMMQQQAMQAQQQAMMQQQAMQQPPQISPQAIIEQARTDAAADFAAGIR